MSNRTSEPPNLPLDPRLLRRRIALQRGRGKNATRDQVTRVLLRTDAELLALAYAVNQGLSSGDTCAQITRRVGALAGEGTDNNVVLAFLRAVGVDRLVARRGTFAEYHIRKSMESAESGRSAYTCRRGPARRSVAEIIDDMEFDDDTSDYIRGQGAI